MELGVNRYGGVWMRTTLRDNISAHTVYVDINDEFVAAFIVSPMPKQVTLKMLGYVAVNEYPFSWKVRGINKVFKGEYGRKSHRRTLIGS